MQINTNIPRQKIPKQEKDKEWGRKCIDAFYDISIFTPLSYEGQRRKKKMYDMYNGIINDKDYTHVLKPYGKKRENMPAKLHNYPIVKSKIDLLVGEKHKQPLNFSVVVENQDVSNKYIGKKKEELKKHLYKKLTNELKKQGAPVKEEQFDEPPTDEKMEEFDTSYRDKRAIIGQQAINIINKEQKLKDKFVDGFKDFLLAGEVFSRRDIVGDEIIYERLNPLQVDFDKSPDTEFVEDADWAIVRKHVHPSDIIDEYYDILSDDEIDQIENPHSSTSGDYLFFDQNHDNGDRLNKSRLVELVQVYWKSMKQVKIVDYVDKQGVIQKKKVEEDYEMNPEDLNIESYWINEVWRGTRIDTNIYVNIEPIAIQRRDKDNPSKCKLPINGRIYSDRNSSNVSIAMLAYPYQLLYNIFHYRLEMTIAKSKDVIAQLDINMIPQDWDMDKYLYYIDALGIAFQDYAKEGNQPNPHAQQVLDLSAKTIEQYISLMNFVREQLDSILGINQQRQGNIGQHQTKANAEYALSQSSSMTTDLFTKFAQFEEKELRALLDYSKWSWIHGKTTSYAVDDGRHEIINIDGLEHSEANYGIYVSNARRDVEKLQQIKELGQAMVQNGAPMSTIADIMDAESFAQIKKHIDKAEETRNKMQQAAQKAEKEAQEREYQLEMEKIEADLKEARMNNETKLKQEQIRQGEEPGTKQRELDLKEREIESNERITEKQMNKQ